MWSQAAIAAQASATNASARRDAFIDAQHARKSQLAARIVFADALAQRRGRAAHVEQIVRDLKRQPQPACRKLPAPRAGCHRRCGDQRAELQRDEKHRAGLAAVDRFEGLEPGMRTCASQIVGLAAHQLRGAGGVGQQAQQPSAAALDGCMSRASTSKRQGQQRVAGQDGGRLAVDLVTRGPAAAQVVVVHRRQIVVNQRIGVDHFHGAGRGQRGLGRPWHASAASNTSIGRSRLPGASRL